MVRLLQELRARNRVVRFKLNILQQNHQIAAILLGGDLGNSNPDTRRYAKSADADLDVGRLLRDMDSISVEIPEDES